VRLRRLLYRLCNSINPLRRFGVDVREPLAVSVFEGVVYFRSMYFLVSSVLPIK
jgi:hypothetical protein